MAKWNDILVSAAGAGLQTGLNLPPAPAAAPPAVIVQPEASGAWKWGLGFSFLAGFLTGWILPKRKKRRHAKSR